jgi:site-specific recombinase XerD
MKRDVLDPWIEGYLSYLSDVRRMNPRTISDVRCTLKKVSVFMAKHEPDRPLWKVSLDEYLAWLGHERDKGSTANVLAKNASHLRGLLDYSWRSGRSDRNVLDGFSLQDALRKSPPRALTLEEAQRLVQACPSRSPEQRRGRIVVLLLYGCGLRTSELCALDVQDIDLERRELFIKHGKGNRQRTIPVPGVVWTELLAYLAQRGGKRGALFRTRVKRTRIRQREVGEIVAGAASRASITGKVTARTLRHTFATHLMDRGVDLAVIASLMGHRTPAETGVYLHVLPGKTEAAVHSLLDEEGGEE